MKVVAEGTTPATSATMTPATTTIAAAGGDLALTAKAGSDMATDGTWTFSASPSDAATLSGAATDKGVGSVTLKAAENKTEKDVEITVTGVYTAKDGKTKLATVTATVTVSAKAKEEEKVPTVVLSTGAAASMTAGSTISGYVTGTNLTGKVITYTSSDTSIVTVAATNTSGTSYNVTGKKAGTAYIYAYIDNKLYASTAVTVTGTTPSPEPTPSPTPETIDHDITDFIYDGGVYDIDHNTMEATYTDSVGAGKVEIPRYIYLVSNGKTYMVPVTRIAAKAFKKSDVKKVIMADTVDTIGKAAFRYCRRLEKVAFEDASNIIYIGKNAFANTKDGLVIKQKHGYKFDSDIREDLEKYSNLVIK
ncbi:MAG: leucine-rich repeat protein [Butyrivibrio sp.]|nr:leucine-rich repeat protein [Butyrivibrio sp.]